MRIKLKTNMSSLTEEQKRKIEENKRKALTLRANRQATAEKQNILKSNPVFRAGSNNTLHSTLSSPNFSKTTNTPRSHQGTGSNKSGTQRIDSVVSNKNYNAKLAVNKSPANQYSSFTKKQSTPHKQSNAILPHFASPSAVPSQNSLNTLYRTHKSNTEESKLVAAVTAPSPNKANNAAVKGKCVLVSQNRFLVEIGFSAGVIEVFKTISTRQYDTQTKKWSFDMTDYNTLMQKICGLGSYVYVEPLPRSVINAFNNSLRGQPSLKAVDVDLHLVDQKLVNALYKFQKDAINFAVHHKGRVLIADDMGLGKTLQSLCIAAYYRREWPLLIVVPSSVRFTWREQIIQWLPSIDPQDINVVVTGKDSCTSGLINIVSYDLMVKLKKPLSEKNFKVIIMDESHSLKNSKTARTQVAAPLLKKASRVLLLSGTPALSRPSELFTQLNAIDHATFPKFHEFGVRYCDGKQNPWGWDFTGSSNLAELQLILEEKIMIRRLKKDVLDQLPSKCRQMVILDPNSVKINKSMKASHTMVDKMKGSERRGALLEYFHESGGAKIKAIREYVLDILEADRKFLLFAHHQEILNAVEEAVAKKYNFIRIDGRTSSEQRNYLVNKFQTQDDIKIAILSITAANAGINLTAASLVVFAELFWNPGILMQAEDRAHRIGQIDSVTIHYLVAPGTADDYIWPLVQQKLEVLGKAGLSKDDFSEADTKRLKDPKQKEIMDYFEESFMEDSDFFTREDDNACNNNEKGVSNINNSDKACTSHQQQSNLFQYFNQSESLSSNAHPRKETTNESELSLFENDSTNERQDWIDDLTEDWEDDPDAPWPPKPKRPKY